jgi:hypothetical protein
LSINIAGRVVCFRRDGLSADVRGMKHNASQAARKHNSRE